MAVRSSALDEDSPRASPVGRHLTLLAVAGATAVVEAARRDRVSAAYRDARGLPGVVRGAGQALVEGTLTPEKEIVHRGGRAGSLAIGVLSAAQMREVEMLAVTLETREGHPVGFERADEPGTLQLFRCRPVTSLAPA